MSKSTKKPDMNLRALYVTPTRTRIVKVTPKGNRVKIGEDESWEVNRKHIFPKGAGFDVILPQGQSEAVPVERSQGVTSYEVDAYAETDYLRQVNSLARGAKTPKVSWWVLGFNAAILLALIIVAVVITGSIQDLSELVQQLHGATGTGGGGDSTVYQPGS